MKSTIPSPRSIVQSGFHRARTLIRIVLLPLLGVLFGLLAMRPAWAAELPPLVLGVFPNATAKQIVETYRPLADALEITLKRRIEIYSAPSFKSFAERTQQGEYDLLLTAPNLAWLARQDAGYQPLLKYTTPVRGILVVKSASNFRDVTSLKGKTIAIADSLAVAVLAMQDELSKDGLKPDIDYQTVDAGTHINAAIHLVNGRADAAMLGQHAYKMFPSDLRLQLRVLRETPPLSSLTFLTHPRLHDPEVKAIHHTLLSFAASPDGQAFLKKGGFGGFSPLNGKEVDAFRPYALQTQEILRAMR